MSPVGLHTHQLLVTVESSIPGGKASMGHLGKAQITPLTFQWKFSTSRIIIIEWHLCPVDRGTLPLNHFVVGCSCVERTIMDSLESGMEWINSSVRARQYRYKIYQRRYHRSQQVNFTAYSWVNQEQSSPVVETHSVNLDMEIRQVDSHLNLSNTSSIGPLKSPKSTVPTILQPSPRVKVVCMCGVEESLENTLSQIGSNHSHPWSRMERV